MKLRRKSKNSSKNKKHNVQKHRIQEVSSICLSEKQKVDFLRSGNLVPEFRIFSNMINRIGIDNLRILDVNAGICHLYEVFKLCYSYKTIYTATDKAETKLKAAKKRHPEITTRKGNFSRLNFKDKYDIVIYQDFSNAKVELEKTIEKLINTSSNWIFLYNTLVCQETKSLLIKNRGVDNNKICYNLEEFYSFLNSYSFSDIEFSFFQNSDDPTSPTPSVFFIKK